MIDGIDAIVCETCLTWYHAACLHMPEDEFRSNADSPIPWECSRCLLIKANNLKWGNLVGEDQIRTTLKKCYKEIISWNKNIMPLPRGQCGETFLKELTKLLNLFVNKTAWNRLALLAVHVFVPLMLQKPSARSKPRDHTKYLATRLKKWNSGDIMSVLKEAKEVQKRMKKAFDRKEESKDRLFMKQMFLGRTGPAAKFVNNEDGVKGVHSLSKEIKEILLSKHPSAEEIHPETILPHNNTEEPENIIYEEIDSTLVQMVANKMKGSGGPTQIEAEMWRDFTGAKSLGKAPGQLCQAIADTAKILCTEEVHPDILEEYNACRLIPLDKGVAKDGSLGVRPIGVGEVLRRLVGKLLIRVIKKDIMTAAGPLQTCSGLKAGIEGAIHAMREHFAEEETEGILLVDAENAFNKLNRKAALENIKELCPPFYRYLHNTYQKPAQLIVNDKKSTEIIYSNEGCTQGDVTSMALYALGIKPLIDRLSNSVNSHECIQCWFADDSSSGGKLTEIKKWWDELYACGPKYGYYPLPRKTILIVKEEHRTKAEEIFKDTGILISSSGERHMGACVGSQAHKEKYVNEKVEKWVKDIEELARLATDEPQAVYTCYTKAVSHRWTFIQRTIPEISHLFTPLEEAIRDKLIPALVGRKINDVEREIFSLPVRYGGMNILNPIEKTDQEFRASVYITEDLSNIIKNQEISLVNYNEEEVLKKTKQAKSQKEADLKEKYDKLMERLGEKDKRMIELAQDKGAGAWLSALPMKALGYVLNKQEFRDSVCLRYGWSIPDTPAYCQCGKKNDIDHTLICPNGGYVYMRHNGIRDLEGELMREVCRDVKIEPVLQPIGEQEMSGITSEKARLDVSGVGVWGTHERTFLDIKVFHPNSKSFVDQEKRNHMFITKT